MADQERRWYDKIECDTGVSELVKVSESTGLEGAE